MGIRKFARFFSAPFALATILLVCTIDEDANAIQVDWGGQFWFDNHWLNNYQLDRSRPGNDNDPLFNDNGSPYVPGVGEKNVVWYSAFLRLNPKVVVNDNIQIKSEWHVGSPVYGFFGRGYPSAGDERFNFTGAQKDNAVISAQRFWANLITDFGTVELGRAPIHWGLGAIWNAGNNLFERYQSTGDLIRLTAKFGNFFVQPALVKTAMGSNLAGANTGTAALKGNDDVTDYDLAVKYDNSEEDFEFGMMWTKRSGNSAQKTIYFNSAQAGSNRINFNIFDFYTRKKWSRFSLGAEIPIFTGDLGSMDQNSSIDYQYKSYAFVLEGDYNSDLWDIKLKGGHVPGQPSTGTGDDRFHAVYLNKDYGLGLIMFHYNLYGLSQNNADTVSAANLKSPFDAEIVNANYLALSPELKLDKWSLKPAFIAGFADKAAQKGRRLYDHNKRKFYDANGDQGSFLGWEVDAGVSFRWDENFVVGWDLGLFFPGSYYEFSNQANGFTQNTNMMFASRVQAGITF